MALKGRKGISDFVINIKKTLDEVGLDLASGALENKIKMKLQD